MNADGKAPDAGAPEFDENLPIITSQMEYAGAEELMASASLLLESSRENLFPEVAVAIYRAMWRANP